MKLNLNTPKIYISSDPVYDEDAYVDAYPTLDIAYQFCPSDGHVHRLESAELGEHYIVLDHTAECCLSHRSLR